MASGTHTYESDDGELTFELEWTCAGEISDYKEKQHQRLLEATAEEVADYVSAALAIGEHWKLDNIKLDLDNWSTPMCRVWLRGPPGYLDEDSDDPDAAEKVAQRKEFYRNHNAVYDERLLVDGNFYPIKIDVRQI